MTLLCEDQCIHLHLRESVLYRQFSILISQSHWLVYTFVSIWTLTGQRLSFSLRAADCIEIAMGAFISELDHFNEVNCTHRDKERVLPYLCSSLKKTSALTTRSNVLFCQISCSHMDATVDDNCCSRLNFLIAEQPVTVLRTESAHK